jgi:DNA repair exonuclease SbcCD ATPase subunit
MATNMNVVERALSAWSGMLATPNEDVIEQFSYSEGGLERVRAKRRAVEQEFKEAAQALKSQWRATSVAARQLAHAKHHEQFYEEQYEMKSEEKKSKKRRRDEAKLRAIEEKAAEQAEAAAAAQRRASELRARLGESLASTEAADSAELEQPGDEYDYNDGFLEEDDEGQPPRRRRRLNPVESEPAAADAEPLQPAVDAAAPAPELPEYAEQCPICKDAMDAADPPVEAKECGHQYHLQCFLEHVTSIGGTPIPFMRRSAAADVAPAPPAPPPAPADIFSVQQMQAALADDEADLFNFDG